MFRSRILLGFQISKNIILMIIILLSTLESIRSLKLMDLRVPAHVLLGTQVQLSCRWQLGPTDVLYSVKWYKNGKEFFRHVPKDQETLRKFLLPGVNVDESESDSSGENVTLSSVSMESSGRYRCEVSGERPLFLTVSEHADLEVIVPPDHGPKISGFRSRYNIGDKIQANCTSGPSKPATELNWYINNEPAPSNSVRISHYKHEDSLETTTLSLEMSVKKEHFTSNRLIVKCLATITPLYWKSNEESATTEREKVFTRAELESIVNDNTKTHQMEYNSGFRFISSIINKIGSVIILLLFFIYN